MLGAGLAALSLVMGFAWMVMAWVVTGSASTHTDTELAWRSSCTGYLDLKPFVPWLQGARFWGDQWHFGGLVLVFLALPVLEFAVTVLTPAVRRLGPDLRFWSATYMVYLLAVSFPQSSTFPLLMPPFPLLGAVAQPRSWVDRMGIVAARIVGQCVWLVVCWWVDGYDWTPP